MSRRRFAQMTASALFVACSIALMLYLFRGESWDNSELGRMSLSYRWGRPFLFSVDANRDGRLDAEYHLTGGAVDSSSHWEWSQGWESTRCDGRRDLLLRRERGALEVLFDRDRDGHHEVVVEGAEAERFVRDLVRGRGCVG